MRGFAACFFAAMVLSTNALGGQWTTLAPGMELGSFTASRPSSVGDSRITILRIDPTLWELVVLCKSWDENPGSLTAGEWCEKHGLSAATNAGMFATDHTSHVGYLDYRGRLNGGLVEDYQSVAAFDPKEEAGLPEFRIFDLDDPDVSMETILRDYSSAIQNLRLIKRNGENRWSRQDKKWSEAALGEDENGRVLFIFSRSPFTMHDLNEELVALGVGLVAAQHLEGGPEAQLFVRVEDLTLEEFGSYETSFREDDLNAFPWTVPNVLGVRPRSPAN